MRTPEQIIALFNTRKRAAGPVVARMAEIRDAYNGDIVLPLPEMERNEQPAVANLIAQGVDQTAQRIASVLPDVDCPALRPGIQVSEERANLRRQAYRAWWAKNGLGLIQRQRARWLITYASSPVTIRYEPDCAFPVWAPRNPLTAFPPATTGHPLNDMTPENCIFTFRRSLAWLRSMYPTQATALAKGLDPSPDDQFEIVEYVDDEQLTQIVLGRALHGDDPFTSPWVTPHSEGGGSRPYELISRMDNLARICPAVVPGRITLDRPTGQFDGLVGLFMAQAELMALETIAVKRSIFPDQWMVSNAGETGVITVPADGVQGIVGEVQGAKLETVRVEPGVQTYPTIDRLERAMRLTGSIPAEMGGESGDNIRTARRGAAVLSSAIDFPIQEYQEILALALREENIRAAAIEKAHSGDVAKSFFFTWKNRAARADYTADDIFTETAENQVNYSFPGSDINQLIVGIGQRIGMRIMSNRRGMELDPLIDDPEREHDLIIGEGIEQAVLQAFQTGVANGTTPPADAARVAQLVVAENVPLYEAILRADREAQERQATVDSEGNPTDVPAGSPEAMPGLAAPGQGAEAGVAVPEQPSSLGNVVQLLRSLNTTRTGMEQSA